MVAVRRPGPRRAAAEGRARRAVCGPGRRGGRRAASGASPAALSSPREPAAAHRTSHRRRRARPARARHGPLHRDRAQVPLPVEHHRHRVPRPGAQGRRLGRGDEGDRPLVSERSKVEMEEAPRQLPRRAEAAVGAAGQGAGRGQEGLPLEVHGADAVPAAAHEQPQEGRAAAARQRRRQRRPRALLRRLRLGARRVAQAQGLRPARAHRPQARLLVQDAIKTPSNRGVVGGPAEGGPRGRGPRSDNSRRAGYLLHQHVPVHQAVPVPHADQDQEGAVQRRDRGGGGAGGGAAELREPVGAGGGLLVQQRPGRRGGQGLLSRAAPPAPPRRAAVPLAAAPVRRLRGLRRRHRRPRRTHARTGAGAAR